jgi:hypothetical protein
VISIIPMLFLFLVISIIAIPYFITGKIRCDTIDIAGNNQWLLLISQEIKKMHGYY